MALLTMAEMEELRRASKIYRETGAFPDDFDQEPVPRPPVVNEDPEPDS